MDSTVKIIQNNNGYSLIEFSPSPKAVPMYYTTPAKNAKKFGDELKLHVKKRNINANVALGSSVIIGVLGAAAFTKKMSKTADIAIKVAAGTILAGISALLVNNYNNKKYYELLNKYSAQIQN